nr:vitamin B12-binding protein [Ligilactobacillus ruminis]
MRKRRDYGHISKIGDLPVIGSRGLRADFKNRGFARNRRLGFTDRFQKSRICP